VSICCFAFLALDLLAVSTLAFARALSVSKGLQAALALVQGAQEVAWLQKEISKKKKQFEQYLRQGLGNTQDSEVRAPLTRTSLTNNWRPHFSCQLLVLLMSLQSFLWQVSNTLSLGQKRKVN